MEQKTLQEAWEETDKAPFIAILRGSKSENLSETLSSNQKEILESAYDVNQEKAKVMICADERVMPLQGEFKIGTAGQLIMDSKEYIGNFVSSFKGKIKAVRSHSGCGAAGAVHSKLNEEEKQKFIVLVNELSLQGIPTEEVTEGDLYGAAHSYDLAQKLGAEFGHTPFCDMRGHKDFHDARVMFWSADPTFDPSFLTDKFFPPHFLSNGLAFGLSEEYCRKELKFLSSIASGEHGFGDRFNSDNPLYVISVARNKEEAQKLNGMAKETLRELGEKIAHKYISR